MTISGVTPDGTPFNGEFPIDAVLNATTFKVTLGSVPELQHGPNDLIACNLENAAPVGSPRLFWPVAKVTTAVSHGLVDYDVVTIGGVSDSRFNDTFVVMGATGGNTHFYFRLKGTLLSSNFTQSSSFSCHKLTHRFDEVMRGVPPGSIVRISPGLFETRGLCALYYAGSFPNLQVGYQLNQNTRLVGSGMGATTLKLVHAIDYRDAVKVVGCDIEGQTLDVSDFTADCNLPGQPVPVGSKFALVVCAAVSLAGHSVRIRRVRAIRFGTQSAPECFAFLTFSKTTDPAGSQGNLIEECIAEEPSPNNIRETSLFTNSTIDPVAADNRAGTIRRCYASGGFIDPDLGRISSEFIAIAAGTGSLTQPDAQGEFTVITRRPHNRVAGQNVRIYGVVTSTGGQDHPYFNDTFEIVEKISNVELRCKMRAVPSPTVAPNLDSATMQAYLGARFHGPTAIGGSGCVMEGNSVYDCPYGFYTDTGVSRSLVQRENYYSNVLSGGSHDFLLPKALSNPREADPQATHAITRVDGDPTLARFTAEAPHSLRQGMAVLITGARINGQSIPAAPYNGYFTVAKVNAPDDPQDKVFFYRMTSEPDDDADAWSSDFPVQFAALWQTGHYVVENNLIDMYRTDGNSPAVPRGSVLAHAKDVGPFVYPEWIVRENIVRHVDHALSSASMLNQTAAGFQADSVEHGLVEQNIIDAEDPNPIHRFVVNTVRCFNNRSGDGRLLRCVDLSGAPVAPDTELEDLVESAAVLAL